MPKIAFQGAVGALVLSETFTSFRIDTDGSIFGTKDGAESLVATRTPSSGFAVEGGGSGFLDATISSSQGRPRKAAAPEPEQINREAGFSPVDPGVEA